MGLSVNHFPHLIQQRAPSNTHSSCNQKENRKHRFHDPVHPAGEDPKRQEGFEENQEEENERSDADEVLVARLEVVRDEDADDIRPVERRNREEVERHEREIHKEGAAQNLE